MKVVTESVQDARGLEHPLITSRPLGLDMAAITAMAPAYGIDPNQSLFDKLHAFETACLAIGTGAGCTPKQKKNCEIEHGKHLKWTCANCPKNRESDHGK